MKPKLSVPSDILSEMETLQIRGGAGSGDVHVYAIDSCKPNVYSDGAYCANCQGAYCAFCQGAYCANCVPQCDCDKPPVGPPHPVIP